MIIHAIGTALIEAGDHRVTPTAERTFALLLYLGTECGRRVSRDTLQRVLFPAQSEQNAGHSLRQMIYKVRQLGIPIETDGDSVMLPTDAVRIDYRDMLDAPRLSAGELRQLEGGFLPDYVPTFSPSYVDWVEGLRARVSLALQRPLVNAVKRARAIGDWPMTEVAARACLAIDPVNEQATLALAETLGMGGSRAAALRVLDSYLDDVSDGTPELRTPALVLRKRISERLPDAPHNTQPEARFVGRTEQLRSIDSLLASARVGRGGALMLTGPAGIGKTRLLSEAAARATLAGMQFVRVRCQAGDASRPLSGVVDLVPQLLALRGAAGCDPQNVARLRKVARADDGPVDTNAVQASPEVLRAQIITALLDVLDAASGETAVVLQVDDLQWAHRSLGWLWEDLLVWSATHPVAWIFALRTTGSGTEPERPVQQLAVTSLDATAAAALVDDIATRLERPMNNDTRAALLTRGGGSPLFLQELARQWALGGSVDSLPNSLTGLIAQGLSTLSAAALRALQVAAVLGTQASLERAEAIMQLPRTAFVEAILELDEAGILTSDVAGAMHGHVLWADAALARLPEHVRRVLHRHAAERFDAELLGHPSVVLLWEAGHHWEQAGNPNRARETMVRGAEHLNSNGFPDDAAAAYARVLGQVKDTSEELPLLKRRIELLYVAGCWNEIVADIDRHEQLASELCVGYTRHSSVELIRKYATFALERDMAKLAESMLVCARDDSASVDHRLCAAKECARAGEIAAPRLLAEAAGIASSLPAMTAEERWDQRFTRAIYHECIGNPAVFLTITRQMVDEERATAGGPHLGQAITLCGRAHFLNGNITEAQNCLTEGIRIHRATGKFEGMYTAYGYLVEMSLDFRPPAVTEKLLGEVRKIARDFSRRGDRVCIEVALPSYEAELSARNNHPQQALSFAIPLSDCLTMGPTTWRLRPLAIHLSARMQLGENVEIHEIARAMEPCFDKPDYWHDWPATVYATYLVNHRGRAIARAFAEMYVREVRRELFPPPAFLSELANEGLDDEPAVGAPAAAHARVSGA